MDTRFLDTFITIAECGSIAEAARRLNRTPAALAQRLQALERDLGQPLLKRAGRTVQPTAAGLAILDHARALLAGVRDLRALAAQGEPAGQLRLGATATALTGLMPAIIAELSARFPALEYFVEPGSSVGLYHRVIAGDLDAALIVRPPFAMAKTARWLTLRQEPLVFLSPRAAGPADPRVLIGTERFIRYDRNQWGGQIVDAYLRDQGLAVREWLELDALDAIAALVDRGLGVSIVPDWAPPWPAGLALEKTRLADAPHRHIGLVWREAGARQAAVGALVNACHVAGNARQAPSPAP